MLGVIVTLSAALSLLTGTSTLPHLRLAVRRVPVSPVSVETALPAAAPSRVMVEEDAKAVAAQVFARVDTAAQAAIAERGYFALAIPGGSILKMLAGTKPAWAAQTTIAYVNHKVRSRRTPRPPRARGRTHTFPLPPTVVPVRFCPAQAVPIDDAALASHAKARALFLDGWEGCSTLVMGGTSDAASEAQAYEAQLRALPANVLPITSDGLPVFDIALIGVGDDGHVGSLYPGREEVLDITGR
jgi:6-phosphogluconolactonase